MAAPRGGRFLFGEVRGDEYRLVVMLSDQELKKPQV
jgi:hypothetical protein